MDVRKTEEQIGSLVYLVRVHLDGAVIGDAGFLLRKYGGC